MTGFSGTGAKLLSPFGLFSGWSFSEDVRKRMISRYGYIPAPESARADIRGLSLFLSDFVMDTGPLLKRDEDLLDAEEGNAGNGDEEEASSAPVVEMPLLGNSERNTTSGEGTVERRPTESGE